MSVTVGPALSVDGIQVGPVVPLSGPHTSGPVEISTGSGSDLPITTVGTQTGDYLVAGQDGTYRPARPPAQSYHHDQPTPVLSWLITHNLPFTPSGVLCYGADNQRLYPLRIAHPGSGRTRIDFPYPVPGIAELS